MKNIIKRIIVGVGIALVISFLKSSGVFALDNLTYQFTFNNSNPILWKENVSSGGYYNVTIRPVVAFSSNVLTSYTYLDVLYTTDYMTGSAHVNGYNGVFASGDYTPVCLIGQNDVKSTCILQIPILNGGGYMNCGVSGGQCTTDNPTITFYNWATSQSSLNVYGAYFTNTFHDDVTTELANFKLEVINILEQIKNNSSNANVVGKLQEQIVTQQGTNQRLDSINNSINNDDTTGANSKGAEFFNNFQNNDFGLSDIITIPLSLIQSCTSTNCQELTLTLPFVNRTFNLPCMTNIYQQHFPTLLSIYQTITFGIVAYWVSVQIYALVKGFKEPDSDKIEVVDL